MKNVSRPVQASLAAATLVSLGALASLPQAGCSGDDSTPATMTMPEGGTEAAASTEGGEGSAGSLTVMTQSGPVQGIEDSDAGSGTRAFLAIPYAAPPTGANRWRSPQPVTPWTAPRDATTPSKVCPQLALTNNKPDPRDSEDCLTVNVWTPDPPPSAPLPVMVWIHGGAFLFGSGAETFYDGTKLVNAGNVVVVSMNYRLGALGFMALPQFTAEHSDHPTSGNYGFEDQQAALTWVKNNIAAFGGDPAQVTIFGESAGGHSVCAHLIAPGSKGLFQRAISESGYCAEYMTATRDLAYTQGQLFAGLLGCPNDANLLTCLRGKTPEELISVPASKLPGGAFYQGPLRPASADVADGGPSSDVEGGDAGSTTTSDAAPDGGGGTTTGTAVWGPVIDGVDVPTMPGKFTADTAKVPLILGNNSDEGTIFQTAVPFGGSPVADEAEFLGALGRAFGTTLASQILGTYPVASYASANEALNQVTTDGFFACPVRRFARAATAAAASPSIYVYALEHAPEQGLAVGLGVFHAADLAYVFGFDTPLTVTQPDEQPLVDTVQGYWTRFTKTGDPNGAGAVMWPKYEMAGDQSLVLNLPASMVQTGYKKDKCDFWDSVATP